MCGSVRGRQEADAHSERVNEVGLMKRLFSSWKSLRESTREGTESVTTIGPGWENKWSTFCTVGKDVGLGERPPDGSCSLGEGHVASTNLHPAEREWRGDKLDLFSFLHFQCPAIPLAKHDWKSEGKGELGSCRWQRSASRGTKRVEKMENRSGSEAVNI